MLRILESQTDKGKPKENSCNKQSKILHNWPLSNILEKYDLEEMH